MLGSLTVISLAAQHGLLSPFEYRSRGVAEEERDQSRPGGPRHPIAQSLNDVSPLSWPTSKGRTST